MQRLSWWFAVPVLIFGWSGATRLNQEVGRVWLIGAVFSLVAWLIARRQLPTGAFIALLLVFLWGPNVFHATLPSGGCGQPKVIAMLPVYAVLIVHGMVLVMALVWGGLRAWAERRTPLPPT